MKYLDQLTIYTSVIDDINELILDGHYNALYLSMPGLKDLTPLAKADVIEVFQLQDVEVEDVSPLEVWKETLVALALTNTKVTDVSPICQLDKLKILDLSDNQIVDPLPLVSLPEIELIKLTGNPVSEEIIKTLETELPDCTIIFLEEEEEEAEVEETVDDNEEEG